MTPPTPVAVRAVLKSRDERTPEDQAELILQYRLSAYDILRDHIRAVAQEMRFHAIQAEAAASAVSKSGAEILHNYANDLRVFADKLEGKQNEQIN